MVPAEFFPGLHLVLLGAFLVSIGDRWQGSGSKAFRLQNQPLAALIYVPYAGNGRHIVLHQPAFHRVKECISVRLFRAGIREEDQLQGNVVLVQPHQQGGGICPPL